MCLPKLPRLLLIIFGLLSVDNSMGQTPSSHTYPYPVKMLQHLSPAPDGGFYFCGRDVNLKLIIGKTDSLGIPQWAKSFGNGTMNLIPYDLITLQNGNSVILFDLDTTLGTGTHAVGVLSTDLSGNVQFCKKYDYQVTQQPYIIPFNLVETNDGFLFSLTVTLDETHLVRADTAGNFLSSHFVNQRLCYVHRTQSGNFVLRSKFASLYILLDSLMNYQNSILHGINALDALGMFEMPGGDLIIYGKASVDYAYIIRTDATFNFVWGKVYRSGGVSRLGSAVDGHVLSPDTLVFLCGDDYNGSGAIQGPHILMLNGNGDVINHWESSGSGKFVSTIRSRSVLRNGVFTFITPHPVLSVTGTAPWFSILSDSIPNYSPCGMYDTTFLQFPQQLWSSDPEPRTAGSASGSLSNLLLTETSVMVPYSFCGDTLLGVNNYEPVTRGIPLVYPNPFSDMLTIELPDVRNSVSTVIDIIDVNGRYINSKIKIINNNEIQLNPGNLSKGIYMIRIQTEGKTFFSKVVR